MNNFAGQKSLEKILDTPPSYSMSDEQKYINVNSSNINMRKSTPWWKKGLLGLAAVATLGFGAQNVNAQTSQEALTFAENRGVSSSTLKNINNINDTSPRIRADAPSINYSIYEESIPGAIKSSSDVAFKKYWISQEKNMSSSEIYKNLRNISSKTKINNAYYWLAKIKNNDMMNFEKERSLVEKQNPNMINYINATKEYYKKNWKQSRLNYTIGLFKTFGVKKDHLEYLGINQTLSEKQIYTAVANKFIEADYEKKEEILEKLILKSKGYNNGNIEKRKMAYDFLGGFILSNYNCGKKKESLNLRNKEGSQYRNIRDKNNINFNTASNVLY